MRDTIKEDVPYQPLPGPDYPVSEDPFVLSEQSRDVPTSSTVSERGAIWVRLLVVEFVLVVVVVEAVRMLFRRTWLFVLIL